MMVCMLLMPSMMWAEKEAWVGYEESTQTLTFHYDENKSYATDVETYGLNTDWDPSWLNHKADIVKVAFDASFEEARPTSCYKWFNGFTNLASIEGLQYLNTSEVTTMYGMFQNCSSLTELKFSDQFTGINLEDAKWLFAGCTSLTDLDLRAFKTTNKFRFAQSMFQDCTSLKHLDLTGMNTSGLTFANQMFMNCSALSTIYVSDDFPFGYKCIGDKMFDGCTSLPGFDSNATDRTKTKIYPDGYVYSKNFIAKAVYDSSTRTLTFCCDENSRSDIGTEYALNADEDTPGWLEQNTYIERVVFEESFSQAHPTTCYRWFYNCKYLTDITGLEYLNTEKVTNMSGMFYACSSLSVLDLRDFATSKVTTMASMFANDSKLSSVLFSDQFTGTSLESANELFSGCTSLTELDLSDFETTSKLTSTKQMFTQCSSLDKLDISGLNTSGVTDMSYMFAGCTALSGVLVSHTYTVDNVSDDANMFYNCGALPSFSKSDIGKEKANYNNGGYFTYMGYADYNATTKTLAFYSKGRFAAEASDDDEVYDLNTEANAPGWVSHNTEVEKIVVDDNFARVRPTSCYRWFYKSTKVPAIEGLTNLNTSEVTNMESMFRECSSLTSLDLSSFNPEKVTTMEYMFRGDSLLTEVKLPDQYVCTNLTNADGLFMYCRSLKGLDLSGFKTTDQLQWINSMFRGCSSLVSVDLTGLNTTSVQALHQMFQHCSALRNIYVSDTFVLSHCMGTYVFQNCTSLPGFDSDSLGWSKAKYFPEGYFYNVNPAAWVSYDATASKLTFHYDNTYNTNLVDKIFHLNIGHVAPQWAYLKDTVSKVVIEEAFTGARPTSCYQWFYQFSKLPAIDGLTNLNTSEVTSMQEMFRDCPLLTALDLSSFNTEKVTRMGSMFRSCPLLTALDLSSFNTEKVTDMGSMLRDCVSLQTLSISNFDTQMVTDMSYMLYNDSTLTDLTLSSKLTGTSLQNATAMFKNCKSLTALDLRCLTTTEALKTTDQMFESCSSIKYINIPTMNTSGVTNMSYMFQNDAVLKLIWAGDNFVVADSVPGDDMFKGCVSLTGYEENKIGKEMAVYFPEGYFYNNSSVAWVGYDTQNKTLTFYYDSSWDNATEDKIYSLNTGTNLPGWYQYRNEVEKVVIEKDFSSVRPTTCYHWFDSFTHLQTIEGLTYLNTSEVTNMESMFYGCELLTSLNLSSFNTEKVTTMKSMFNHATALKEVKLSDQFTGTSLEDASLLFMDCTSLKSANLSSFKTTAALTDLSYMFRGCSSVEYINLGGLNTFGVKEMLFMFAECSQLSTIMVSDSFTVANLQSLNTLMFQNCTSLPGFVPKYNGREKACYYPEGYFYNSARSMWTAYDDSTHTLTFHYDTERDSCKATYTYDVPLTNKTPEWISAINADTITVDHVIISSDYAMARPTSCYGWFLGMKNITEIEGIENLNTSEATSMESMFRGCTSLKELDVSRFSTANVVNTTQMFSYCSALTGLDFRSWDLSEDLFARQMFYNCSALEHIYVSEDFALNANCNGEQMFVGCAKLPNFLTNNNDKTYAHYKTGGYLTLLRQFSVGSTQYTAYGWGDETTCYDDVTFTDGQAYSSTFDFALAPENTASYTRTAKNHWATLCLPFGYSAENATASFYSVKSYNDGNIIATPITTDIAAGTPVLAYITDGELSITTTGATAVATPVADPVLQGVFAQTEVKDDDYIIANDHFWNAQWLKNDNDAVTNVYVAPYRAYLTLTSLSASAKPNSISIDAAVTDRLVSLRPGTDLAAFLDGAELYDLQGRRLTAPKSGVMIIRKGGVSRKVVIKGSQAPQGL